MRLVILLSATLTAAVPGFADVSEGQTFRYACDGGGGLQAAYVNVPSGDSYAVVAHDGKLAILKAGPTGSGVRYVSIDGTGLVWHVKGPEGFLAHDDAEETMILRNCRAQ